jgi:hypothetical protein
MWRMPVRYRIFCFPPPIFVTVFTSYCRVGFTCRCVESRLFGTPNTPGGQAQYVRVPRAGGTLYNLEGISAAYVHPDQEVKESIEKLADSSLLLLSDILPTGVFAAFQALNHPKTLPMLTSRSYPQSPGAALPEMGVSVPLKAEDQVLTIAIIGLGPVGVVRRRSLAWLHTVNAAVNVKSARVSRWSTCSMRGTSSFALSRLTRRKFDKRRWRQYTPRSRRLMESSEMAIWKYLILQQARTS